MSNVQSPGRNLYPSDAAGGKDKRRWLAKQICLGALFDWVAPVAIKISKPPDKRRPGRLRAPERPEAVVYCAASGAVGLPLCHRRFPSPLSLLPLAHGHRPHGLGRTPQATGFTGGGDTTPAPPYKIWVLAARWCSTHLPAFQVVSFRNSRFHFQVQAAAARSRHRLPAKARGRSVHLLLSSEFRELKGVLLPCGQRGWWFTRSIPWPVLVRCGR